MPDAFFTSNKPRKRKRSAPAHEDGVSGSAQKSTRKKLAPAFGKNATRPAKVNGAPKRRKKDEELESDRTDDEAGGVDDMDLRASDEDPGASGEEDEDETPAEKRLRLAQLYLESVKEDLGLADGEFDAAEIDRELISARLKQDVLEHSGKVHLFVADTFDFTIPPPILRTRGHRFSVTSAVASESGKHLFTSGKEGSIIQWDLASGKRLATFHKIKQDKSELKGKGKKKMTSAEIKGHTDEVWALAVSSDGKYLASGGKDRRLGVWDVEKGECLRSFAGHLGHKDSISALAFKKGSHQLYTASYDRTLKVYDLSPSVMGYVETLFGHQDHALALDALRGDTCVSVGGRDKTVRYWKIVDETQLVFRGGGRSRVREILEGGLRGDDDDDDEMGGGDVDMMAVDGKRKGKGKETKKFIEGSMECVAMIDENTFVSGGDSGSLSLWTTQKKKPIFTQAVAHGLNEVHSETEGLIQTPRWITALASLRYSDLIASGSWEGDIRIWKLDAKLKSLTLVGTYPAPGIVNSLQFVTPPKTFFDGASWAAKNNASSDPPQNSETTAKRKLPSAPVLLVAGMGQEHRFGRWLTIKGEGAVNGALVFALSPRTLV